MNRVGLEGRGESVWLAWFRHATLTSFADACEKVGRADAGAELRREAATLRAALEVNAWDGHWYLRGYYDDGSPLGSARRDECRIDSVAQSWAVLSGAADPERARLAMQAVREQLVRDRLVLLFAPPFDRSRQDPGYIRAYPPGVRENGGQYTHAAVWVAWAFLELGESDLAADLLGDLLPVKRARDDEGMRRYRVEPYVLAADVYGAPPFVGRGGWTWYTGSAGWAYRLGWEGILGLCAAPGGWRIDPHLPSDWPSVEITLRDGGTVYEVRIDNPHGVSVRAARIVVDGDERSDAFLPRFGDGRVHRVEVLLDGTATETARITTAL